MKEPRAYQYEAANLTSAAFRQGKRRVLVCCATASGKTIIGMEMIRRAMERGKRCLFLADRNILIKQFAEEARDWDLPHGTITRNGFSDHNATFQIASKDTFSNYYLKKKNDVLPSFDLVLIDECLAGDSVVTTEHGKVPISQAVAEKHLLVLSEGDDGLPRMMPISDWMDNGRKRTIEIKLEDGRKIRCTENHPIFTSGGWSAAGSLVTGSMVKTLSFADVGAERNSSLVCSIAESFNTAYMGIGQKGQTRTLESYSTTCAEMRRSVNADAAKGLNSSLEHLSGFATTGISQGSIASLLLDTTGADRCGWLPCPKLSGKLYSALCLATQVLFTRTLPRTRQGYVLTTDQSRRSGLSTRSESSALMLLLIELKTLVTEKSVCACEHRALLLLMTFTKLLTLMEKNPSILSGLSRLETSGSRGGLGMMAELLLVISLFILRDTHIGKTDSLLHGSLRSTGQYPSTRQRENTFSSTSELKQEENCFRSSRSICRLPCNTSWTRVVAVTTAEEEVVYDITVPRSHRFYANGILVHNCHRSLTMTWKRVLECYSKAHHVGLTATPIRPNGKALSPEFEHLVMPIYPSELLAGGFIVPARCYSPTFPDLKDVRKDENGDYRKEDLNKVMNRHNMIGDVYTWWKRLGEDRPTITYGVGIDHCLAMRDEFLRNGVKAAHINGHSTEDELEDAFEGFKDGKYKVLTSAEIMTEGVNLPLCACIQIVRPTKSLRLYNQIVGRGCRIHPESGKSEFIVIDHAGCCLYHGLPNQDIEWSLDPDAERIEKRREKEREEGKLPTPIVCPKCFFMYQGLPACPSCGHKPQRKAKALRTRAGVLVRVDKSLDGKPKPGVDYNRIWSQCLAIAANKGRNFSMAAAVFKGKTGVPPWAVNVGPMPPDDGTGSGRCNWQANVAETYPNFIRKRQEIPA